MNKFSLILSLVFFLSIWGCTNEIETTQLVGSWEIVDVHPQDEGAWVIYPPLSALEDTGHPKMRFSTGNMVRLLDSNRLEMDFYYGNSQQSWSYHQENKELTLRGFENLDLNSALKVTLLELKENTMEWQVDSSLFISLRRQ